MPGTLNYVEGNASLGTQALSSRSIGATELQPGQTLKTAQGRAEVLLSPGAVLRIGDNSSVRMVSPSLTNTQVQIESGQAMIEVDEVYPDNEICVLANGIKVQLKKTGLYAFDDRQNELRVFDGKAQADNGRKHVEVESGHELKLVDTGKLKPQRFDQQRYEETGLYRWSSMRSSYLAEANVDTASAYVADAPGWWGANWYWDPWFDAFTFIPANGIYYSPFGSGFYSPWMVYQAPIDGCGDPRFSHQLSPNYPGGQFQSAAYTSGTSASPGSVGLFHSHSVGTGQSFGAFGVGGFHSAGSTGVGEFPTGAVHGGGSLGSFQR